MEPAEFYRLLALLMYLGIIQVPSIDKAYSKKSLYNGLWCRAFLVKRRFKQIMCFLKLSNMDNQANSTDKLFKVRLFVEYIRRKSQGLYQPNRELSIDERMVRNKGRYSWRQYIQDKPTKWGMKLWVLAEPATGYTYDFAIYLGKAAGVTTPEGGLAYNVVMDLVRRLANKEYNIFLDNFYTTIKLLKGLFLMGIGACGIILSNRRGFPTGLKDIKQFDKRSKRGNFRFVRDGQVATVQWRDNKTISVASNFHLMNEAKKVFRRCKVDGRFQRLKLQQPIADYNRYMGGVDLSDQIIGKYNVLRKTDKWWKTLFFHMIDIAKVNSFILFNNWRAQNPDVEILKRTRRFTQLDFTEELIRQLGGIDLYSEPPVSRKCITFVSHSILPVYSNLRRNYKLCYQIHGKEQKKM